MTHVSISLLSIVLFTTLAIFSIAHAQDTHALTLGLVGYSPVSYIESNRAEPGSPEFSHEYKGVTYFFTSADQVDMFKGSPERFIPAYGGFCAFGCSVNSEFIPDPTNFKVIEGRTHLFLKNADLDARQLWNESNLSEVRAKADAYWDQRQTSRAYLNAQNLPASGVGIQGFSPVSYFTSGEPTLGDPRFAVEHEGVSYHLASQREVELFKANPDRYAPQCGGWCAFGMSVKDKFPVDPTSFKVIDRKLYLFLNNESVDARALWNKGNESKLLKKALAHWQNVSG